MGNIEQDISANDRSIQDKTTEEICKMWVRWCHKGPRRLNYWARNIERWFTKIGGYYLWFGTGDPQTV